MLQNIKQIKLVELQKIIEKFQYVIIDKKVFELYKNSLGENLDKFICVDNPENHKSVKGWSELVSTLLSKEITRKDKILAIGGGALSDLAGFVAASILRGIEWSVVPTTLLSMIDASIGGKVGINHEKGKNLIGSFYQPNDIFISEEFLETLSNEELQSGMGEVLKYTILSNQIFQMVMHDGSLNSIINACALYKRKVVEEDFKEGARRKILNLGHTLGHAYEKLYDISHGIGVVIGLKAIVSVTNPYLMLKLMALIEKMKIQTPDLEKKDFDQFWNFVMMDKKKVSSDEIEIIVPLEIGQVIVKKIKLDEFKQSILKNDFIKSFNK